MPRRSWARWIAGAGRHEAGCSWSAEPPLTVAVIIMWRDGRWRGVDNTGLVTGSLLDMAQRGRLTMSVRCGKSRRDRHTAHNRKLGQRQTESRK